MMLMIRDSSSKLFADALSRHASRALRQQKPDDFLPAVFIPNNAYLMKG
jgi:hypothetical protein